jgi:hypothetical protein
MFIDLHYKETTDFEYVGYCPEYPLFFGLGSNINELKTMVFKNIKTAITLDELHNVNALKNIPRDTSKIKLKLIKINN